MNDTQKGESPHGWMGAGPGNDATSEIYKNNTTFALNCQVSPRNPVILTTRGGPGSWGIADALHELARVLVDRGLLADDDRLAEAVSAAWVRMGDASYLTEDDRAAWAGSQP